MTSSKQIQIMSYEVSYTHQVRVAVNADSPAEAEEIICDALSDTGITIDSTHPLMISEAWVQDEGQVFVDHEATVAEQPKVESSVLYLRQRDLADRVAETLLDALEPDGTINMELLLDARRLALESLGLQEAKGEIKTVRPSIFRRSDFEFEARKLDRNSSIWLQIENFDLSLKRTDEGLVVDVYAHGDHEQSDTIATTYAFDSDTRLVDQELEHKACAIS